MLSTSLEERWGFALQRPTLYSTVFLHLVAHKRDFETLMVTIYAAASHEATDEFPEIRHVVPPTTIYARKKMHSDYVRKLCY